DPHLAAPFSLDRPEGKAANRQALSRELNLAADGPLFGMVSRLAGQKGVNLVVAEIPRLVSLGARVCVLGTGQLEYHEALRDLADRYPGSVVAQIGFDEALAHRIYAGSDFFLMPSEYEPCGLGQMIALRYGTLPVAARTGGLADTVFEVGTPGGNGFLFARKDAAGFAAALDRALALHARPDEMRAVRKQGMATDFSWIARANEYLALYRELTG
ncbi:MAG TPA: glycosyltransferase, partial [candidate division WOR-3 bacterium]|nr:glycosyltransferase [candidate division WOR-3 bacterium]